MARSGQRGRAAEDGRFERSREALERRRRPRHDLLLADALEAGLDGRRPLAEALAGYERARDDAALPMYEFTTEPASFAPPKVEERLLFASLAGRQDEIDRFFGVITGAVPFAEYFPPRNLVGLIGVRGMAKVMLSRLRPRRVGAPQAATGAASAA
jgi:hypothetical protein